MSTLSAPATPTRLLRRATVCERLGISDVTLWRMERRGDFPPSIQISGRAVGWRESDVEDWISQREALTAHAR